MKKSQAQSAYRSAWQQFLLTPPGPSRNQLDDLMNSLVELCGKPGKEWEEFVSTLAGYVEYWEAIEESPGDTQLKEKTK